MTPPKMLRVANCSGFYGDRLSAAREMVEGGPIDVLTGDWLAELTMYILHKTRERSGGFARSFLRQMDEVLPVCLERGIKIVANAGGLDPPACARALRTVAEGQGVTARIATVTGDDLGPRLSELRAAGERFVNLETAEELAPDAPVVTAHAYLGAAPIAAALSAGADVVITGRVTDASLVVGPGIWAFGWGPDDLDQLAGAVVAGHVIECGAQCCGGNYAFFEGLSGLEHIGFPLAELAPDGSAVITKHPGTGGAVTKGTVVAQLLYEIAGPRYLSPDAVARFDTIAVDEIGPDRVRLSGTRGEPPPPELKVAANLEGGWRNAMTLVLTGGSVEAKAGLAESAVWAAVPGGRAAFAETRTELVGDRRGTGTALLRLAVRGEDPASVGRGFSSAVVETSLAGYPGLYATTGPGPAQEVARYWPTTVAASRVRPAVELKGVPVPLAKGWEATARGPDTGRARSEVSNPPPERRGRAETAEESEETVDVPLGVLVGARSGDKGGDANLGLWAETEEIYRWLADELDAERLRQLLLPVVPEVAELAIERAELPNLGAVNFVLHGLLGWGVASNLRLDGQAKALGELARSRPVGVPSRLVADGPASRRLIRWRHAIRTELQ